MELHSLQSVALYCWFNLLVCLFTRYELLPPCHVLILNDIYLLDDLSDKCIVPSCPYDLLLNAYHALFVHILDCFGLLVFEVETYLASPINFIGLDLPIVEISLLNVVDAVSTANWRCLWKLLVFLLGLLLSIVCLFLLFLLCLLLLFMLDLLWFEFLLLHLLIKLLLSYTIIRDIHAVMIEELAEWSEISGVHEWAKAPAYCVNIHPFVIIFSKDIAFISKKLMSLLQLLEFVPLQLKVISLQLRGFPYAVVLEGR